jgi:hypothetical protein
MYTNVHKKNGRFLITGMYFAPVCTGCYEFVAGQTLCLTPTIRLTPTIKVHHPYVPTIDLIDIPDWTRSTERRRMHPHTRNSGKARGGSQEEGQQRHLLADCQGGRRKEISRSMILRLPSLTNMVFEIDASSFSQTATGWPQRAPQNSGKWLKVRTQMTEAWCWVTGGWPQ